MWPNEQSNAMHTMDSKRHHWHGFLIPYHDRKFVDYSSTQGLSRTQSSAILLCLLLFFKICIFCVNNVVWYQQSRMRHGLLYVYVKCHSAASWWWNSERARIDYVWPCWSQARLPCRIMRGNTTSRVLQVGVACLRTPRTFQLVQARWQPPETRRAQYRKSTYGNPVVGIISHSNGRHARHIRSHLPCGGRW